MRDIDRDAAVSMDSLRLALDRSQQRHMPDHKRARRVLLLLLSKTENANAGLRAAKKRQHKRRLVLSVR